MKFLTALSVGLVLMATTVTEAKGPIFGLRGLAAGQSPPVSLGAPGQDPTFAQPNDPRFNGPQLNAPQFNDPQFNGPGPGGQIEMPQSPGDFGPLTINPIPASPAIQLHPARYRDLRNIHPCAVKTIIQVKDPCYRYRPLRDCGPPPMVFIEVCLPPGCPRITGTRDMGHVKYSYGKYQVEITSRMGRVVVDYDD